MGCSLARFSPLILDPGFIGKIAPRKPEMLDMGVKTVSRVIWPGNGPGFQVTESKPEQSDKENVDEQE